MSLSKQLANGIVLLLLLGLAIVVPSATAVVAYFIISLITPRLLISLPLAAMLFAAASYAVFRLVATFIRSPRPRRAAGALASITTLAAFTLVATPTIRNRLNLPPDYTTDQVMAALPAFTFPLLSVDAENGFEDLRRLQPILQDRRIIALGEASHGTSEFFRMKHRMLEFLVCEMGYQHFGMETSPEAGQVINDYITGGAGDPKKVLYWPWATVEVMEMLDWMRRFNAWPDAPFRLTFHGIDPVVGQRDRVMAANVARILAEAGPDGKIVLWAHNAHISRGRGWMGSYLKESFGDEAYLLAFEFDRGAFTSNAGVVHTYSVGPAPPGHYAHALARLDPDVLFLDFETMAQDPALRHWLAAEQRSWDLQELHAFFRLNPARYILQTSWTALYDGLIFVEESTPAASLRHYQLKQGSGVCQEL
jgi:erythromycin esterase-like protein